MNILFRKCVYNDTNNDLSINSKRINYAEEIISLLIKYLKLDLKQFDFIDTNVMQIRMSTLIQN